MPHQLTFEHLHLYDTNKTGITVDVRLKFGNSSTTFEAKVDTGASCCIFERVHAESLGHDVESGSPERISTANSYFTAYGHWVIVEVLGFELDAFVFFAADENIRRNVLGRRGWIDMLKLGLVDYDGKLYLSLYGDE